MQTSVILETLLACRIVGARKGDDLPCHDCGQYGDVLIMRFRDEDYRDLCVECAAKAVTVAPKCETVNNTLSIPVSKLDLDAQRKIDL